jgi:hypothetical protein
MWPFDAVDHAMASWLLLYLGTLALHAVFVGYVLAGSAFALVQAVRKPDDPLAAKVRDWLPFMLGAGITAGVAPLLFVQLLYQRRFYTANLLLGPRWGAVVPALIAGFYALYVAKASVRFRRPALVAAVLMFGFVAWSWTELHQLMNADARWTAMYAAGERLFADASVPPRLLLWLGAMTTSFATIAVWQADARRPIAVLALAGRAVSVGAVAWMSAAGGFAIGGAARGWLGLLVAALVVEAVGWIWTLRAPASATDASARGPSLATAGGTAALIAAVVVREAPRLALLEPSRVAAEVAGGGAIFAVTLAVGVAATIWIVRTVRAAAR